jgi:hypothetical protein
MLYQDFDSGLNEARTHHGVEHNSASAYPIPIRTLGSGRPSSAGSRPPRRGGCHDVARVRGLFVVAR